MKRPCKSSGFAHRIMKIQLYNNLIMLPGVPSGNWKDKYFQMKKITFLLICCLFSPAAFSQVVAVQADKMNILYMSMPNPITIAVGGKNYKTIKVTIDNGEVIRDEHKGKGHYIVNPVHVGTADIGVYVKTSKGFQKIGGMTYRVKRIPVTPYLCGRTTGRITPKMLYYSDGPNVAVEGGDIVGALEITGYTVRVMCEENELLNIRFDNATGTRFDKDIKRFFKRLKSGDDVFIEHITCKDIDGSEREVSSMQFKIISETEWKHLYE